MITRLQPGRRYVLDGALATELERRGADLDHPLWSARILLTDPALIEAVHDDYCAAGAHIITSASYQASLAGLRARGLDAAAARRLLRESVALCARARARFLAAHPGAAPPLIAASLGPFGAHRHDGSEYHGRYGVDDRTLRDFHAPQLEILAQSGADLLAFETLPSLQEGQVIARLLEEFPGVGAWLSYSCQDGARLCHGEPFAEAVALSRGHPGIVATGVNCTDPRWIEPLLHGAAGHSDKPLLAYPNSGERWCPETRSWRPADEVPALAAAAPRWLTAGAALLGGCCRTTPAHIRALAQAVAAVPGGPGMVTDLLATRRST